jgi:hypothetical protein
MQKRDTERRLGDVVFVHCTGILVGWKVYVKSQVVYSICVTSIPLHSLNSVGNFSPAMGGYSNQVGIGCRTGPPAYVAWLLNSRPGSWNRFLALYVTGLKFSTQITLSTLFFQRPSADFSQRQSDNFGYFLRRLAFEQASVFLCGVQHKLTALSPVSKGVPLLNVHCQILQGSIDHLSKKNLISSLSDRLKGDI